MAIQAWERSLQLDPTNVKLRIFLNLAKFHTTFTNSLSDEEFLDNYKNCLQELSKLKSLNANDTTVTLALCSYLFSKGDYNTVIKIVEKLSRVSQDLTISKSLVHFPESPNMNRMPYLSVLHG